jgi:hypothetical protein
MRHIFVQIAALSALASCGGRDPVADQANNTANLTAVVRSANATAEAAQDRAAAPPADGRTPATPPQGSADAAPAGPIPSALRGRWGLTPRDCTSALGDAKGLLVINADELRFYESRAVPTSRASSTPASISGEFGFTGEGQKWSKTETLELKGDKLVRTETSPMASYTYARCK